MRGERALLGVLAAALAATTVAALGGWQAGLVVLGAVLLVAAGLRALLPPRRLGLLVVRSRMFDVLVLAALGAALVVLTGSLGSAG
ncbi:MAG TPA: DUF3017 domain-containing protein [Mycobacteriales bacterium]|jgi:hypothetical protein|nr:DUF3017 domain-containing protein [Mycobacteriales bacterium]